MRTSQYFITTAKEAPSEAEIKSHQLMLRAGLIRKLASGLYTWLPLGLRVLKKVEAIIRQEINRTGALEILMPVIQPAELWQESERWEQYGPHLLKMQDRHERAFCFGPTHEEIITDLMRRELHSYKQLPLIFYQIQVKFRDEIRPRFGLMRAREFLMKDAYSFHADKASLEATYQVMHDAYLNIFKQLGLNCRAVLADSGNIGGSVSHEFQVLAQSGEDVIAYSDESEYTANIELAEALMPVEKNKPSGKPLTLVDTPNQRTIKDICAFLSLPVTQTVKTLIVKGKEKPLVALVLRGDHELNLIKAQKLPEIANPLSFATAEETREALSCDFGSLGPINLAIPVIVDRAAAVLTDFCCGANQNDKHYCNANWPDNITIADLRTVVEGDKSPDGKGTLKLTRGIEVGHIFQLGSKYSKIMQATITTETGENVPLMMGCYGIGVSRIVAAAIEQHHDERGICWPQAMAPFQLVIIPLNANKSAQVKEVSEKLYQTLLEARIDVLYDDRNERPGVMFAEMELIGIPHRLVISARTLSENKVEYQARCDTESQLINLDNIQGFLEKTLSLST